jgi:hypothetical protein
LANSSGHLWLDRQGFLELGVGSVGPPWPPDRSLRIAPQVAGCFDVICLSHASSELKVDKRKTLLPSATSVKQEKRPYFVPIVCRQLVIIFPP